MVSVIDIEESIRIGARWVSLEAFLRACLSDEAIRRDIPEVSDEQLENIKSAFLTAGMDAVQRLGVPNRWLQFNVRRRAGEDVTDLIVTFARQAESARMAGAISNWSFLRKPPGLRMRVEVVSEARDTGFSLDSVLWSDRAVRAVTQAVYEPESHLFGGKESMSHVHRLFTWDSRQWARYFQQRSEGSDGLANWQASLQVLRRLFAAMSITDLEDLDVWDRIRTGMGRSVPDDLRLTDEFKVMADELRTYWRSAASTSVEAWHQSFGDDVQSSMADLHEIATKWREEYFETPGAYIGPREAVAFFVIFHWNRGGLSSGLQSILVEALADREALT